MKEEILAVAKAVEKSAECGQQALQTGEKVGGFFARVFKEPIEQSAGILTDCIKLARLRRWDAMADEVSEILARRGITETRAVSPKLGLPLLQDAALEDESELQKLWTNLLANAMDPSFQSEVRVSYTEIIKSLTSLDARIVALLYNSLRLQNRLELERAEKSPFSQYAICTKLGISDEDYLVSIDNLMRMQCVAAYVAPVKLGGGIKVSDRGTYLAAHASKNQIVLTALGVRFVAACSDKPGPVEDNLRSGSSGAQNIDLHHGLQAANI